MKRRPTFQCGPRLQNTRRFTDNYYSVLAATRWSSSFNNDLSSWLKSRVVTTRKEFLLEVISICWHLPSLSVVTFEEKRFCLILFCGGQQWMTMHMHSLCEGDGDRSPRHSPLTGAIGSIAPNGQKNLSTQAFGPYKVFATTEWSSSWRLVQRQRKRGNLV